ncbi:MAG: signal peptidase II [Deltaproteobacteria bacterium]|nr:signal peptidase II [Deltaproteobacteria bacterium]
MKKYLPLFIVIPLTLLLDHWSKFCIVQNLKLYEDIPIIKGFFEITHVRNPGIAFGMFANWDSQTKLWFFYAITLIAIFLMSLMYRSSQNHERKIQIPLALIMGGALGNMTDRMYRGNVVDFLHFHWKDKIIDLNLGSWSYALKLSWPSFNVADIAISCGAIFLAIVILFGKHEEKET